MKDFGLLAFGGGGDVGGSADGMGVRGGDGVLRDVMGRWGWGGVLRLVGDVERRDGNDDPEAEIAARRLPSLQRVKAYGTVTASQRKGLG